MNRAPPRTVGAGTRLHSGRLHGAMWGHGARSVPVSRKDNLVRRNNVPSLRPKILQGTAPQHFGFPLVPLLFG